jgi:hypothetical protein
MLIVERKDGEMKELTQTQAIGKPNWKAEKVREDNGYVWPVCGAGVGLIGGVLAPLLGAILTVFSWVEGNISPGPILHEVGTGCFFLTVPLLVLGACCLDALEKRGWKIGH